MIISLPPSFFSSPYLYPNSSMGWNPFWRSTLINAINLNFFLNWINLNVFLKINKPKKVVSRTLRKLLAVKNLVKNKKTRMLLQKGTYSDFLCNTLIQYSDTIDVTMLKYLDKYCSLLALTIQLARSFDILLGSFLS